ncbi:co-chaperone DjlA [Thalassotalea sp. Y01]|uniref:co-chaperone DjlA n=1 Tax=Thalassotalea sp. Y01 TaxID=2729613 RepID=UPI00145E052B|nr:co-chaperone DjlA [Thalassotalea sp. Y01]NMP15831.1 co-chaperone DjlA [Thalassotalea sp. Y01]
MRIWGKVIGFLLGFMAGRLIGALLGLWLGHKVDKGLNFDFSTLGKQSETDRQRIFFDATYSIMGHIAKASGRVSEEEIAFASASMKRWGLDAETTKLAQKAFGDGKQADFQLQKKIRQLRVACFGRHDLLQMFIEIQIQAAFADGDLHPEERRILHKLAKGLGISSRELDALLDRIVAGEQFHQQGGHVSPAQAKQQLANAYRVLGVDANTDFKEVKKSYRKLMAQHHPDKLVAKGLPPELMDDAKQKAQDIQAAYELVSEQNK